LRPRRPLPTGCDGASRSTVLRWRITRRPPVSRRATPASGSSAPAMRYGSRSLARACGTGARLRRLHLRSVGDGDLAPVT